MTTASTRVPAAAPAAVRRGTTVLSAGLLGLALALTAGLTSVHTQDRSEEYRLKAALLFNVIRFVDWPPDLKTLNPLEVCVLGPALVADAFAALDGRTIRDKTLAFTHVATTEEIASCKVVFVGGSVGPETKKLLLNTSGTSVLTVGETTRFVDSGGIIAFAREGNKIRFEVNLEASTRAGITIRSDLLRLASGIRPAGNGQ